MNDAIWMAVALTMIAQVVLIDPLVKLLMPLVKRAVAWQNSQEFEKTRALRIWLFITCALGSVLTWTTFTAVLYFEVPFLKACILVVLSPLLACVVYKMLWRPLLLKLQDGSVVWRWKSGMGA